MPFGSRDPRDTPRRGLLPAAAMVAVLAAGAVLSATNPAAFSSPGRVPLLDGRWASRYQARYEQDLPLRPLAAAFWDLARYAVFSEGARGVLVGREGWLYTAEEFEAGGPEDPPLAAQLDLVRDQQQALAARGVALVVALVPAKARIHPEHLGRYTLPARHRARYEAVRRGLAARGVSAPDLLQALRVAARGRPMFLRTDTHWTPDGAQAAARALAPLVAEELERAGSPRARFTIARDPAGEYRGDLLNFIRLGPWFRRFGPPSEVVSPLRAVAADESLPGLFDEIVLPVVLVGTSYSAGTLWGFDQALKAALQADVLNAAEEGRGPFLPMRSLLEGPVLADVRADVRADVVVWEIPERYFPPPP